MLMNIAPQTPAQVQKNDSAFVAHTVVLAKKQRRIKWDTLIFLRQRLLKSIQLEVDVTAKSF